MADNEMAALYNEWYCRILSDAFIFHAKDADLFIYLKQKHYLFP